jgi:hypothetical protein
MFLRPSFLFAWLFAVVMLAGVAVSTDVIVWNVPSRATSAASTNIPSTVLQVTWSLLVGRVNVYNGRDSANICVQAICDETLFNADASSELVVVPRADRKANMVTFRERERFCVIPFVAASGD